MKMFYCTASNLYNSVKVTKKYSLHKDKSMTNHTLITIMKETRMKYVVRCTIFLCYYVYKQHCKQHQSLFLLKH